MPLWVLLSLNVNCQLSCWSNRGGGLNGNKAEAVAFNCRSSDDSPVNAVGTYNGTVPVKSGPVVTMITSDGRWSITFS